MTKIIKNRIINIFGLPGSGKTFLCSYFAFRYFLNHKKIISNVDFFYKNNEKRINKKIYQISDIQYIEYQENGGLIIIDEGGLNINSRQSNSKSNMAFAEMLFLSRKKNCDLIFIAQLDFSIDKYVRCMSNANLNMNSYFDGPNHLIFTIEINKGDYTIGYKEIDLLQFAEESGFIYSSLESSKIGKKDKEQIEKEMKKILKKEIQQKKEFEKSKR